MSIRRVFVDGPDGQVHARTTPPRDGAMPLVCLHATAYSSQSFLPLMQALGDRRQVIAIDAPGYGDSDAPAAPLDIAGYAAAVEAAVNALHPGPVALLGYHTGAYVACEMALRAPARIKALTLIGVPYFQALDFDTWRARLTQRHTLGAGLDQFDERWRYLVADRHAGVPLPRAFANFVDELKAWPHGSRAHEAMFAYDADARLPAVTQPVLVLNPEGHLAQASRVAAGMMPAGAVIELPGVQGPVLELAPDVIAGHIDGWLGAIAA